MTGSAIGEGIGGRSGSPASTSIVMVLLIAGTEQSRLEVSSTETRSPFAGVYEKVGPVLACGLPFTLHIYDGFVPPFVGFAVKVTDVPEQTVFALAVMLTAG